MSFTKYSNLKEATYIKAIKGDTNTLKRYVSLISENKNALGFHNLIKKIENLEYVSETITYNRLKSLIENNKDLVIENIIKEDKNILHNDKYNLYLNLDIIFSESRKNKPDTNIIDNSIFKVLQYIKESNEINSNTMDETEERFFDKIYYDKYESNMNENDKKLVSMLVTEDTNEIHETYTYLLLKAKKKLEELKKLSPDSDLIKEGFSKIENISKSSEGIEDKIIHLHDFCS
jgi:hypothetical protein